MKVLRASSEDEMVAEFLKAEVDSTRFGSGVARGLQYVGADRTLIDDADLSNAGDNVKRSNVLTAHRGWKANAALFVDWPHGLDWQRVVGGPADLRNMRYAKTNPLRELSDETMLPSVGAMRILDGYRPDPDFVGVESMLAIAELIKHGETFAPPIAIAAPDGQPIVLVEGHARVTAYAMTGFPDLEMLIGIAPIDRLSGWHWYPKS